MTDDESDTQPQQVDLRSYARIIGRDRMREELIQAGCPVDLVDAVLDGLLE